MTQEEYEANLTETLARVPPEFREFVERKAWNDGHSCGFSEVLLLADEMIDSLDGAIEKFAARLKKSRKK